MEHTLNEQQFKLLDILKWFHSFCVKNKLRYYALGGTMLGAARHQGFIPWDDDIDVGMPRDDYNRFLLLCKDKKFGNLIVESIDTPEKDYLYGYSKIYDTGTTLIEKNRVNIKRGIYIDLFPLDGAGSTEKEAQKLFAPIYKRYQLVVARTCAVLPRRKWYKNLFILIARLIPTYIFNNKKVIQDIDKLCQSRDYNDSKLVANFLGNWGYKEIVPRKVMGTPRLYRFEDIEIYGAENADEYLTRLYGNWRELPPENKRCSHHDYIELDLNKPYMEEANEKSYNIRNI